MALRPGSQDPDHPPGGPAQPDAGSSLRTVEVGEDRFGQEFKNLMPLPHQLFSVGQASPVDLFLPRLHHGEDGDQLEAVCFLPAGRPLSENQAKALSEAGLDYYYAPRNQMGQVVGYVADQVKSCLEDDSLPVDQKAHLVYEQASLIMEQAMVSDDLGENLEQGRAYVTSLHQFLGGASEAPQSLAQMMVLDYGVMTHSVNVCLLTTGFAAHLGLPPEQARELSLGALYHDVGKRIVPEHVLKKPGALTSEEWALMQRHPQEGHDLLARQKAIPPASLRMVLEHHENLDGTGYPRCVAAKDLDMGSRLLRLVDAYDAITAVRAFKGAKHAFEAVRIILEEMRGQIDMELLQDFVAFLGILAPQPGRQSRHGAGNRINAIEGRSGKRVHYTRGGRRIES